MDPEVARFLAQLDQTREELRSALAAMPRADLVDLFRDCGSGRLAKMDERVQLLVGMLAAMAIYDLHGRPDSGAASPISGPHCPNCGEDGIDSLVWLDDEKVRCDSCGTVYDPNRPDAER